MLSALFLSSCLLRLRVVATRLLALLAPSELVALFTRRLFSLAPVDRAVAMRLLTLLVFARLRGCSKPMFALLALAERVVCNATFAVLALACALLQGSFRHAWAFALFARRLLALLALLALACALLQGGFRLAWSFCFICKASAAFLACVLC